MKRFGVLLIGLVVSTVTQTVATGQQSRTNKSDGLDLRVMSFNIRYGSAHDGENHWEKRRELVFAVLRDHQPDIVGLQEALFWQIKEILEALPEYATIGVGRDDGKGKGEFTSVLYPAGRFRADEQGTFWLSDTPEVPGSRSWGNEIPRICTWARLIEKDTGAALYVYNLHLDHRSQPSRVRSVELLAQRIKERNRRDPVIVTGDFNAGEDNPAIQFLKGMKPSDEAQGTGDVTSPRLVDTFRVLHPNASPVGTFGAFQGKRQGKKIDYIFTLPSATVLEASILYDNDAGRYPSDHYPVLARILLAPPADAEPGIGKH